MLIYSTFLGASFTFLSACVWKDNTPSCTQNSASKFQRGNLDFPFFYVSTQKPCYWQTRLPKIREFDLPEVALWTFKWTHKFWSQIHGLQNRFKHSQKFTFWSDLYIVRQHKSYFIKQRWKFLPGRWRTSICTQLSEHLPNHWIDRAGQSAYPWWSGTPQIPLSNTTWFLFTATP